MGGLENDVMVFAGYVTRGMDFQLNLISSKSRSVVVEAGIATVEIKSIRLESGWTYPSLRVIDIDDSSMTVDEFKRFNHVCCVALQICDFMTNHKLWGQ